LARCGALSIVAGETCRGAALERLRKNLKH
jgi:hypothetical protein